MDDVSGPTQYSLSVSRVYPYARSILWDCVTEPNLLAGWLGECASDTYEGGRIALMPRSGVDAGVALLGVVTEYRPLNAVTWSFDDTSQYRFVLDAAVVDPLEADISRDALVDSRLDVHYLGMVQPGQFDAVALTWAQRLTDLRTLLAGRELTLPTRPRVSS